MVDDKSLNWGLFCGRKHSLLCKYKFVDNSKGGWSLRVLRKNSFWRSLFGGNEFLELWDNVPKSVMNDFHVSFLVDVDSQIPSEDKVHIFPYDIKTMERLSTFVNNDNLLQIATKDQRIRDLTTLNSKFLDELKKRPDVFANISHLASFKKLTEKLNLYNNAKG